MPKMTEMNLWEFKIFVMILCEKKKNFVQNAIGRKGEH